MTVNLKKQVTIGCCGIDCGLCPRFQTLSGSVCPGCGGKGFREKHPACGYVTCCVIRQGYEVCSECKEYPCVRFDSEKKGYDSFVTHKKVFENLDFIKIHGINKFIDLQKARMNILSDFLNNYNDGRSKSFFCISCSLLPLDELKKAHRFIYNHTDLNEVKDKNRVLKEQLQVIADNLGIELKLNAKK